MRRAATPIRCIECGGESDELATGWRAYIVPDEDENEDEVAFYCPECAEREFGSGLPSE
jgi:hypothetical protein